MTRRTHFKPQCLVLAALVLAAASGTAAQDTDEGLEGPAPEASWPLEFTDQDHTVVVYQPQPESFYGNQLLGRVAIEVVDPQGESAYGTAWFESRVDTDRTERTAALRNIEVTRTYFADTPSEDAGRFARMVEEFAAGQRLELSFDQLLTSVALADRPDVSVEDVNTAPPTVLYRDQAAVLVTIDGEPILERIDGTRLMGVVNTAFAILLDLDSGQHFLYAGEGLWYTSAEVRGPWAFTRSVPGHVSQLIPPPDPEELESTGAAEAPSEVGEPPEIVVAIVPSELIATVGNAQFTPVPGTQLMVVSNTQSDLLFHTPSDRYFVLLSGRWFRSPALEGPWEYVAATDLPDTFLDIPADSDIGSLRIHIAGTEEADEAVLDAQIPQTAAIDRYDTSLVVEYDGDPVFEPIEDTEMSWAANTETPVIETDRRYYAASAGVWYAASSPQGPWTVATAVPDEIYEIPPTSPVHNVTYVHVYDSTPEVVYVGHTPGYTNTIVHHTTVVYHTGWWGSPWWSTRYIPRSSAWGWHVRWNPWTGWGVGFTWSNGWFTFGIGRSAWRPWCCSSFWGPAGFHRGFHAGRRAGFHSGFRAGYMAGRRSNLYRTQQNARRNASREALNRAAPVRGDRPVPRRSDRENNLVADRAGRVYRPGDGGWEQRRGSGWDRSSPGQGGGLADRAQAGGRVQPSPSGQGFQNREQLQSRQNQRGGATPQRGSLQNRSQPSSDRVGNLNRTQQSRARGSARTQQFDRSRARAGGGRTPTRRPGR